MERLFYQDRWQGIAFKGLPDVGQSRVAGRDFYRSFYKSFLSGDGELSSGWIAQKQQIGRWLVAALLKSFGSSGTVRVLSIGGGLGVVEGWLWEHGYGVDVLECEEHSLQSLKQRYPSMPGIVGDARSIPCRAGVYDLIYMSAVDYCFDRNQYAAALGEAQRVLKPGGRFACICFSNLSMRGMVKGAIKSLLGREPRAGDGEGMVPWGYQRTVGEHLAAGRKAGLVCEGVALFDRRCHLQCVRLPGSVRLGWPTVRDHTVGVTFYKTPA